MTNNFCCPNCGSHDVYSTIKTDNLKKSEHIYTHWHCKDCDSTFIAPQDLKAAINDIRWESKKSFRSTMLICAATLLFAASLLVPILFKDTMVGMIFAVALICAAIAGMIVGTLTRTSASRKASNLEAQMETTTLKMNSYLQN